MKVLELEFQSVGLWGLTATTFSKLAVAGRGELERPLGVSWPRQAWWLGTLPAFGSVVTTRVLFLQNLPERWLWSH